MAKAEAGGMLRIPRRWERPGRIIWKLQRDHGSVDTLIWDFSLPERQGKKCLLFKAARFLVNL